MLRILHISDFHFVQDKIGDFEEISNRLQKALEPINLDLVVFSGDLVYEGLSSDVFKSAFDTLLKPILESKGLGLDRLMIAPGNHDMHRGQEMGVITNALSACKDNMSLEDFLHDPKQVESSFENFKAYNDFEVEITKHAIIRNKFITVSKTDISGRKIGLLNLNSSWRCLRSEQDRGNLLFPPDILKEALAAVVDCDLILCNMHHSLSDFKDFVEQQLDELLYDKCHILFTGHYHKNRTSTVDSLGIGMLHNRAWAVFNRKDSESKYGFCVIDYNDEEFEAVIHGYRYIDNVYLALPAKNHKIPLDEERRKLVDFRKTMRLNERHFNNQADELFVAGRRSTDGKATFKGMFTEPVLRSKSFRDWVTRRGQGERVSVQQIVDSTEDYIIYGGDKCGKTSLLWKILIDTTHNYFQHKAIPLLINCKEIDLTAPKSFVKNLPQYLHLNKRDVETLFEDFTLLLLLDNFRIGDPALLEWIDSEIKDFKKVRIIVSTNETLMSGGDETILPSRPMAKHLFFHEITRKELHQLSQKWPNLTPLKRSEIEKRIYQVFSQMHIPFNYWTASLFMWIFEKTDETNIHNNFELVKLYIEELLNRKSILLGQEIQIQYNDLESYLGELAYFLLKKEKYNYTATYAELITFTDEYGHRKKKFTETTHNTLQFLLKTGTIYEKDRDSYTFRLKGVWEYFLAYHMSEDPEFLNNVVSDLRYYLSFGNELELYAGFRRNDIEFVESIFNQTKTIINPICSRPDYADVDSRLIENIKAPLTLQEVVKIADKSDLFEQSDDGDELLVLATPINSSAVEPKRYYSEIPANAINVQKALLILARVYRNSLVCDTEQLGNQILEFVLNGVCNLGFMINDEFRQVATDEELQRLAENIGAILPVVMQTYLYDAMCQNSLSRVFEEKFNELMLDPENNQFRLFLLGFCLLDLDINKYQSKLSELLSILKKGALRYAAKAKAAILFTKEEKYSSVARNALKDFLSILEMESTSDKQQTQAYIDSLVKRREMKLLAMKSTTSNN